MRVSKPKDFTPSEEASGGEHFKYHVKFLVTLVNGTGKVFDPSLFNSSLQSGTKEGDEVFDSEHGLNGSPETKVLPGREAQFSIGYGVRNPNDMVLDVVPDFDHSDALYSNNP